MNSSRATDAQVGKVGIMILGGVETLIQVEDSDDMDQVAEYAHGVLNRDSHPEIQAIAIECLKIAARRGHEESQLFLCDRAGIDPNAHLENPPIGQIPNELDHFGLGDAAPWLEYQTIYMETEAEFEEATELAEDPENAYRLFILAQACMDGKVTPLNTAEGFRWFLIAAAMGDIQAQREVALCYLYGIGAEENRFLAQVILEKAAGEGDEYAQEVLFDEFGIKI